MDIAQDLLVCDIRIAKFSHSYKHGRATHGIHFLEYFNNEIE